MSVTNDARVSILKEAGRSLTYTHNITVRVVGSDVAATDCAVIMTPVVGWLALPPNMTLPES